jgi:hypothetical protein
MKTLLMMLALCPLLAYAQYEWGDSRLAITIDQDCGAWTGLRRDGRTVLSGLQPHPFDILGEDRRWASEDDGALLQVESITPLNADSLRVVCRLGSWRIQTDYRLLPASGQLRRRFEISWLGEKDSKIREFRQCSPLLAMAPEAHYSLPRIFPPFGERRAQDFVAGRQPSISSEPYALLAQPDPACSVVWLCDRSRPDADASSVSGREQPDALLVRQSARIAGHVRPGVAQSLGDFWLWLQDNDTEIALRRLHEWYEQCGQVTPPDRPTWVPRVTLYSFHPGINVGNAARGWGGFKPSTTQIPRLAELGCNTLWLLPVEDYSTYHPRDYYKLQDGIGSAEEYRELVQTAHELDLRVWQDIVPHGGHNDYPRAIEHPEWLLQEEDGSTLDYWCFDFFWPTWIDYMRGVADHYVRSFGIDGYRIDACGGSKIMNWNPAIPYARASLSQSQGGLAMQRAIRGAVRALQPEGSVLAEAGGTIHGTVSDAVYDFAMCYQVLPASKIQPAGDFVRNLRRWLHEQQQGEVKGLLRLRHIESHDSLRAEWQYGPEPMRAAMAMSAWIYGIPMLFYEMEDGHSPVFRRIFHLRNSIAELHDGTADYLQPTTPDGVFACLRQHDGKIAIPLINFNARDTQVALRLPTALWPDATVGQLQAWDLWQEQPVAIRRDGDRLCAELALAPYAFTVLRLSAGGDAPLAPALAPMLTDTTPRDAQAVLPVELFLLGEDGSRHALPTVLAGPGGALPDLVQYGFQLQSQALADGGREFRVTPAAATREHSGLLLRVPLAGAPTAWRVQAAGGVWEDRFRTRHPLANAFKGNVYHLPQGGNVLWHSLIHPFGLSGDQALLSFQSPAGSVALRLAPDALPGAVYLLDRVDDDHNPHVFIMWAAPDSPQRPRQDSYRFTLGAATPAAATVSARSVATGDPRLRVMPGGWEFDNGRLRLRLSRAGTITALSRRLENGDWEQVISNTRYYTDAGYGEAGMSYDAHHDVEAFARFSHNAAGDLILSFNSQPRGSYRFDILAHPLDYVLEYTLGNGSGFGFSCAQRHLRPPQGKRVFSAFVMMAPDATGVRLYSEQALLASGRAGKSREVECKLTGVFPDVIHLLRDDGQPQLRLTNIVWQGPKPDNLFLHGHHLFLAWQDGPPSNELQGQWRAVSSWVELSQDASAAIAAGAVAALNLPPSAPAGEGDDALLADPSFESLPQPWLFQLVQTSSQLSPWTVPAGAGLCSDLVRHGQASARIVGAAGSFRNLVQPLPDGVMKPGETWRLSVWAKGEGIAVGTEGWMKPLLRFIHYKHPEKRRYTTAYLPMGNFDWTQVTLDFVVPEDLGPAQIGVGLDGAVGTLWLDDMRLERRQ